MTRLLITAFLRSLSPRGRRPEHRAGRLPEESGVNWGLRRVGLSQVEWGGQSAFLAEGTEAFRVAVYSLSGEAVVAEPGLRWAGASAETRGPWKGLEPGHALGSRVSSVPFLGLP